jgi:hypothetical protein
MSSRLMRMCHLFLHFLNWCPISFTSFSKVSFPLLKLISLSSLHWEVSPVSVFLSSVHNALKISFIHYIYQNHLPVSYSFASEVFKMYILFHFHVHSHSLYRYLYCEISGSCGNEYEDGSLLGYCSMLSCRSWLAFQRCLLPPSSGQCLRQ